MEFILQKNILKINREFKISCLLYGASMGWDIALKKFPSLTLYAELSFSSGMKQLLMYQKSNPRAGLPRLAYDSIARQDRHLQAEQRLQTAGTPVRRALGPSAFVMSSQRNVG